MAWFPSLPEDAGVRHIVSLNPAAGRALIEFHDAALRNALGLLPRDKELIAAYVSGLNACRYCYGVHSETAKAFGIDSSLLEQQRTDFDTAPVDARLKSILAYEPAKLTQADAHVVFAVGWSELELHDAVLTICLFNFINRLLEGHGVKGNRALYQTRGQSLHDDGYAPLLRALPPAV